MTSSMKLVGCCCCLLLVAACGTQNAGSRYVKSESVGAANGKTIAVSEKDSALLAGTTLEIPAGALAGDTVITLEVGLDSLLDEDTAAGPVATWGPAGTRFSRPARMTLPLSLSESGDEISVLVRESDGTQFELPASAVTVDAQGRASFTIDGFTSFQPLRRRPCQSNAQCHSSQVCRNGRCRPANNQCRSDADCPASSLCVQAPCAGALNCPGTCQPRPPTCANCPPGSACVNGVCATGCGIVQGCPAGQTCQNNVCVVTGCHADTDCPQGQRCDATTGRCATPPPQCGMNTVCPSGSLCVNGACVAQCDLQRPCPQGLVCGANGVCVTQPPPSCGPVPMACPADAMVCPDGSTVTRTGPNCSFAPCGGVACPPVVRQCPDGSFVGPAGPNCDIAPCPGTTVQCPPGLACVNGQCVGGCANVPCPQGLVCDPATALCRPPPGCVTSMDCGQNAQCVNGACISTGCGANGVTCPPGTTCDAARAVCVPNPTGCMNDSQCPLGAFCVGGQCVQSSQCDPNRPCPQGLACINGVCGSNGACMADSNCGPGQVCLAGRCTSPVTCANGSVCPNGQTCLNGMCVSQPLDGGMACPADAMMCPDGTYVGRTGPNCSFPPCGGGVVDAGLACNSMQPCGAGQQCLNGVCVSQPIDGGMACPADVMMCPNGGFVGRTGPNCTFPPCPGTVVDAGVAQCNAMVSCGQGQTCQNGVCVATCGGVVCAQGQTCQMGVCR